MTHPPYFYLVNGRHNGMLTPHDRGLAYGDGVFRTFPVQNDRICCWERHYLRLETDCNVLGIVCPPADVLYEDVVNVLDDDMDAAIKIIITRGESLRGFKVPALAQPTRIVCKSKLPQYPGSYFSEGVALHLCQIRLSHQPRLAGIKHLNRLENVMGRMEWVDTQFADGLMLDQKDEVIETTMSNLFIFSDNKIITPDLSQCGVAGVTRDRIIELAPKLGYHIEIKSFCMKKLLDAEEVFICNSLYGVWQVRQLLDHTWSRGEVAARLRKKLWENDATSV